MDPADYNVLRALFCPAHKELGSSDKSWNMLSLNPQLHRYWSKGLFGFKLLKDGGEDARAGNTQDSPSANEFASIQVEFRWLSSKIATALGAFLEDDTTGGSKGDTTRVVKLDAGNVETIAQAIDSARFPSTTLSNVPGVTAHHAKSGRPIESGHIITLRVKREDKEKMEVALQAQWVALQMAAFCGAAEVADELDEGTPPLSPVPSISDDEEIPEWALDEALGE